MNMKLAGCVSLLLVAISANADDVVRYPLFNGNKFPIARAVEVPAGTTLIFHSGMTPSAPGPAGRRRYRGLLGRHEDTSAQRLRQHQAVA
jgi:hypothetical protein